ncbi:MAG TPA: nuclear transport factor 2 family protein [Caulobacteraceae bacterium]
MKRVVLSTAIGLALLVGGLEQHAFAATPYDGVDVGRPADVLAVRNVEIIFHQAGSVLPNKDLDLMMSLYADDASLIDTSHGDKLYKGKEQVRSYFEQVAPPFRPENNWIGYTPAMRIRAKVSGDHATLYFECLWMDVDKNAVGAHSFSDMTLERVQGRWLVKAIKVGKVAKL